MLAGRVESLRRLEPRGAEWSEWVTESSRARGCAASMRGADDTPELRNKARFGTADRQPFLRFQSSSHKAKRLAYAHAANEYVGDTWDGFRDATKDFRRNLGRRLLGRQHGARRAGHGHDQTGTELVPRSIMTVQWLLPAAKTILMWWLKDPRLLELVDLYARRR